MESGMYSPQREGGIMRVGRSGEQTSGRFAMLLLGVELLVCLLLILAAVQGRPAPLAVWTLTWI